MLLFSIRLWFFLYGCWVLWGIRWSAIDNNNVHGNGGSGKCIACHKCKQMVSGSKLARKGWCLTLGKWLGSSSAPEVFILTLSFYCLCSLFSCCLFYLSPVLPSPDILRLNALDWKEAKGKEDEKRREKGLWCVTGIGISGAIIANYPLVIWRRRGEKKGK